MSIDVKVDSAALEYAMEHAPFALFKRLRRNLVTHHNNVLKKVKREGFSGGRRLKSRTGFLRRSFKVGAKGRSLKELVVRTFSDAPYAGIHETGGTIRPRRSQWLAIPLFGTKGTPRDHQGFFVKKKDGRLFYAKKSGNSISFLFRMVKEVKLKPRLGYLETWARMEPGFAKLVNDAVKKAMKDVKRG